eukprot:5706-Eustigmatos_ZCMA.PRE.1
MTVAISEQASACLPTPCMLHVDSGKISQYPWTSTAVISCHARCTSTHPARNHLHTTFLSASNKQTCR